MAQTLTILGLESSCDDTAAAVVRQTEGQAAEILSSVVHGQADLHSAYGGVVPEIAARAHAEKLDICVRQALTEAGVSLTDLDAVAVTAGPGLIGGVMSGVMCAKGIAAATGLPLIVHTRASAQDTVRLLREEGADEVGGVMHCFTESWEIAQQAMALNFHISLSGIVTFKNAQLVHEVAANMPLDRLLIETDSPYLAPVPYRGKLNDPSKVIHVAEKIAELKGIPVAEVAHASTENFFKLFNKIKR